MDTKMIIRKAERKQAKIKLGLSGPSGSGKTYSALLIASGMTEWNKIAVIDTENRSADLYDNLGTFNIITLEAPFNPEKYIEAIKTCEQAGMEVIVIDSITHEWSGKGGCLEIHDEKTLSMKIPNSFTAWATVTPRHQAFIDSILQSKCHIITTVRSKTDYVLTDKNGKQVPQKVGLSAITRDGYEYEMTISLDLDIDHKAMASKDRSNLFMNKPSFIPTAETGKTIRQWCESGKLEEPASSVAINEQQFLDSAKELTATCNAVKLRSYGELTDKTTAQGIVDAAAKRGLIPVHVEELKRYICKLVEEKRPPKQ